jgi:hypothetical protein
MIRIRKGNPRLVRSIIASFSENAETMRREFSVFTAHDWKSTEFWLDTSGLALYFIDRVETANLVGAIDGSVLDRLRRKRENNRLRAAAMMRELAGLNRALVDADVRFANLKGFTLSPHSFSDPALRYQSDYDFLVDPADVLRARVVLEQRGFVLSGSNPRSLEFKSMSAQPGSLDRQYEAVQPRSVELHIALESIELLSLRAARDERLDRIVQWRCNAGTFPALSPTDQFIGQALHLLGHLRNENTRPSWFLEFRNHAIFRRGDTRFWTEVKRAAESHRDIALALGLATMLAADLFGDFSFEWFNSWTVDTLPERVRYWAAALGRRAVLADVPGTKLYLLLDEALGGDGPTVPVHMRRLIPLALPPRILLPPPNDTLRLRIRREFLQLKFFWFRLRFHLTQGLLYAIEARRWRKHWSEASTHAALSHSAQSAWTEAPQEAQELSDTRQAG